VGKALGTYSNNATDGNLDNVVRQIGRFIKNLETTHEALAAFQAPEDAIEAFTTYVDALDGQVDALTEAQKAIGEEDLETYDEHGTEFNTICTEAQAAAAEYGFSTCSASDWG
jgi:hypothetical protein